MVVHFTASYAGVMKNIETLRHVVTTVHKSGHILARDWVEPVYYRLKNNVHASDKDKRNAADDHIDAIRRADMVIIEASTPSVGIGYQLAVALEMKKPVLFLTEEAAPPTIFADGLKHELLTKKRYAKDELAAIITDFISENEINNKELRFNFVIDRQLYNHIRWKSFKAKKTKAEVVRELLLKDMEERE